MVRDGEGGVGGRESCDDRQQGVPPYCWGFQIKMGD